MIVEQRDYHVYTGKLNELVALYENEGIELQRRYLGRLVGAFTTDIGQLSMYTHIWAYDGYDGPRPAPGRAAGRTSVEGFLAKIQPLIHTQENRILIPPRSRR